MFPTEMRLFPRKNESSWNKTSAVREVFMVTVTMMTIMMIMMTMTMTTMKMMIIVANYSNIFKVSPN